MCLINWPASEDGDNHLEKPTLWVYFQKMRVTSGGAHQSTLDVSIVSYKPLACT